MTAILTPRGAWNHFIVVLGVPGTGKSTYALARAVELGRTPAYVLAHDPAWRLPTTLPPDGRTSGLRRFEALAGAQQALARDAAGVMVIPSSDGGAVLRLGVALGRASLAAHGGGSGVPVVVLLDEAVGTSSANPYRLGDDLRELVATRRHLHVGVILTAQSPQMAHYALLGLATEIVMFRLVDERTLTRLASVGVPAATLDQVRRLPNYQHVVYDLSAPPPPAPSAPSSPRRRRR